MKLRYIIQLFLVSIALFFAIFWWFENRYIHSINNSFYDLQNSTIPSLTSLLELSSSARRASIKAVEYSMRGKEKDRKKALEALGDVLSHSQKIKNSSSLSIAPEKLKDILHKVDHFRSLVENYLKMASGPSVNQLFDEQEKVQSARRQLIHSFKPFSSQLNNDQTLAASKIQSEARKISVKSIEFSLRGNQKDKLKTIASFDNLISALEEFKKTANDQEIKGVIKSTEIYLAVVEQFLKMSALRKQPIDKIYEQESKIHQARKTLIQSLYPLINFQYENLDNTALKTRNAIEKADFIQKTSSFLFIILAAISGLVLSRIIINPINKLNLAAKRIGEGKLDSIVQVKSNNEIGQLTQAFNDMIYSLINSNERIEYMAYYDELTGLANRRLMTNRLEQALASCIRHSRSGALMMLDLDRFKNINDSLGHAAGDLLLKKVARRLESIVREEDTICRLGGDEFVILMPLVEKDGDDILASVAHIAEKIRKSLVKQYKLERNAYKVTPSIGVVLFPHLDDNAEDLLKRADAAMYRSKYDGGNKVSFYEKAIQLAVDERLLLEKDLHFALENDELFLVYQPQCDSSGYIIGVEVLARWNHPEKGMIPPTKFIEIAEETGMIASLGSWILEKACSEIASFVKSEDMDKFPGFSVNVSAHQFQIQSFCKTVINILKKYQIPAGMLTLELTETAFLNDIESTTRRLHELRKMGIRCSLDDFGTGYSSLSYLSRLPLDELKIDRSFLQDAEKNTHAWSIIEAIIDVAEALNLQVVAEGVEHQRQIEKLSSISCEVFQGYKFYKPLPFKAFKEQILAQI
jgi:diguanylate cyclase (GGDEF)-like protein